LPKEAAPVRYTDYVVAPRGMAAQGKRPLIISSANGSTR